MTQIMAAWYANHARKQPVNMPTLSFSEDEIETHFDAVINKKSGLANIGRKYCGKRVIIIVLKGLNTSTPEVAAHT